MSSTWYEAFGSGVEPVQVDKFTEQSVWIGGRRATRESDWRAFFPEQKDAWDWVQSRRETRIAQAVEQLERDRKELEKIIAKRHSAGV